MIVSFQVLRLLVILSAISVFERLQFFEIRLTYLNYYKTLDRSKKSIAGTP
jgi:hypothetical protein